MRDDKVLRLIGVQWFHGNKFECEEVCIVDDNNELQAFHITGLSSKYELDQIFQNLADGLRANGLIVMKHDNPRKLTADELSKSFTLLVFDHEVFEA